jgi:hypothetical protein
MYSFSHNLLRDAACSESQLADSVESFSDNSFNRTNSHDSVDEKEIGKDNHNDDCDDQNNDDHSGEKTAVKTEEKSEEKRKRVSKNHRKTISDIITDKSGGKKTTTLHDLMESLSREKCTENNLSFSGKNDEKHEKIVPLIDRYYRRENQTKNDAENKGKTRKRAQKEQEIIGKSVKRRSTEPTREPTKSARKY